ncbi:hypothetical protein [Nonomuraea sp. NPDC049400]|uniref:hypothetical protein n=1 Tax=Nonomuraea sp. NPDC049400 TaxID=3364352 RepID=UPI0037BCA4D5
MTRWTSSSPAEQAYDYVYLAGEYVTGPKGSEPAQRAAQIAAVYALLAIHREMATPWWRKLFRLRTRSPQVVIALDEAVDPDADPWACPKESAR